jgi:hypothetical protein
MKVGGLDLDTKIIRHRPPKPNIHFEIKCTIFVKLGFMLVASTNKLKSLKHMALDF